MGKKRGQQPSSQGDEASVSNARVATRTAHLQQPFLDAYTELENETMAAEQVGVSRNTIWHWKKDEAFLKRFTAAHLSAQKIHNDQLRASAIKRAITGSPRYLIKEGKYVLDEKKNPIIERYDLETQLTIFMLKNRMPDEFRDKFEHEISGQLIVTLASEFLAIVKRHAPVEVANSIQKELETLSAKLTTQ